METIQTNLNPDSEEFKGNAEHHRALANELKQRLAKVREGGGERRTKKFYPLLKLLLQKLSLGRNLIPRTSFGDNDLIPQGHYILLIQRVAGI